MNSQDVSKRKRGYAIISEDIREKVIQAISQEHISVQKTIEQYNLKPSSVRSIIRVFKREGRIHKKKTRRQKTVVCTGVKLQIRHPHLHINMPLLNLQFQSSFLEEKQEMTTDQSQLRAIEEGVLKTSKQILVDSINKIVSDHNLRRNMILGIDLVYETKENREKMIKQNVGSNSVQTNQQLLNCLLMQRSQHLQLQRIQQMNNLIQQQAIQNLLFQNILDRNLIQSTQSMGFDYFSSMSQSSAKTLPS